MCFAPQRHALFQHLDFQKWSGAEVFCTFSLRNRLRATTCNFSSLISPDVSAPAALASLLFDPPEPQNHEETQCFATFPPFRAPASSFFWSFLFWLFSLLTAFSSLHIVGSLTSKLPSIMDFPRYFPIQTPSKRLNHSFPPPWIQPTAIQRHRLRLQRHHRRHHRRDLGPPARNAWPGVETRPLGTHFSMKIMMEMMENNGNDTWKWWKIWFSISTKEEKKKSPPFSRSTWSRNNNQVVNLVNSQSNYQYLLIL